MKRYISLKYLMVPESKEVLRENRVSKDTGASLKEFLTPKVE